MCSGTLADRTDKSIMMCMSEADGIVSTSRETPCYDFQRVQVVLILDPVKYRFKQAVW